MLEEYESPTLLAPSIRCWFGIPILNPLQISTGQNYYRNVWCSSFVKYLHHCLPWTTHSHLVACKGTGWADQLVRNRRTRSFSRTWLEYKLCSTWESPWRDGHPASSKSSSWTLGLRPSQFSHSLIASSLSPLRISWSEAPHDIIITRNKFDPFLEEFVQPAAGRNWPTLPLKEARALIRRVSGLVQFTLLWWQTYSSHLRWVWYYETPDKDTKEDKAPHV